MAFYDTTWYVNYGDGSTTGYYAVTVRPQNTAVAAGVLRRQFTAPPVGSERVFVCIVAGTTANTTDATWVLTRGAKTTDNTVTWMECTGIAAVNGDKTNTVNWTQAKAIGAPTLGTIIQRNNGASYQMCTTAGTLGASEPSFSDTAGVTTTETSATTVWTSLGVVGNFTGGQAPHARLAAACAANWFAPGNTVYVGDNHAESQATLIAINPLCANNLIGRIICHNHSGSYPPVSSDLRTTATVSTTANVVINILSTSNEGPFYFYGVTFKAVVGTTGNSAINIGWASPNNNWLYFDNCSFWLASTIGTGSINICGATVMAAIVTFNNTSVKFAAAGQSIDIYNVVFIWQNTAPALVSGSTVPSFLLSCMTASLSAVLEALDLSILTSSLFTVSSAVYAFGNVLIKDCKLNASATVTTPTNSGVTVQLVRSDSGATGYKSARYQYEGTETTETSITRVGGASDPAGQAQSRKIVTTANSQWLMPFKAEPYAIWNAVTGANVTVTVYGTINAGALPNNDDIWLEVDYLGSSATPLGTIKTTTKSNVLAAGTAVASDSSVWNGTTGGSSVTTYTTPGAGSQVVPAGMTTMVAEAWGPGGGAAGGSTSKGCGGGGGGYSAFTATVTPGQTIYYSVSAGGAGSSSNGNSSGNSWVNPASNAQPSSNGCVAATGVGGTGLIVGVGGAGSVGTTNFTGGDGGVGVSPTAGGGGGGAGSAGNGTTSPGTTSGAGGTPDGGAGGAGGTTVNGGNGVAPGGGGGGSWNATGGNGGNGQVRLTFSAAYTPFKLTTTLNSPQPGMAGYIHARVRAAKPSTTYYVDPMVVLS